MTLIVGDLKRVILQKVQILLFFVMLEFREKWISNKTCKKKSNLEKNCMKSNIVYELWSRKTAENITQYCNSITRYNHHFDVKFLLKIFWQNGIKFVSQLNLNVFLTVLGRNLPWVILNLQEKTLSGLFFVRRTAFLNLIFLGVPLLANRNLCICCQ